MKIDGENEDGAAALNWEIHENKAFGSDLGVGMDWFDTMIVGMMKVLIDKIVEISRITMENGLLRNS